MFHPLRIATGLLRGLGLYGVVRGVLGRAWAARLMARVLPFRVISEGVPGPDRVTVLVFSAFRWPQDVRVLSRAPDLHLIEMDQRYLHQAWNLFRIHDATEVPDYHNESDPRILEARRRLRAFATDFMLQLKDRLNLDCAVTPAMHYRIEQEWAAAADAAGVPFLAAHKEFTVIDERHVQARSDRYRDTRTKFLGSRLLVTNALGKRLMAEGGVFPAENIHVAGLMRMDRLFNGEFPLKRQSPPLVTLFSFGHLSGGVTTTCRRSHYFSGDDVGFIRMFEQVHGLIVRMAVERPGIQFAIKMKNIEDWWKREIDAVAVAAVGRVVDDIPNIVYTEEQAPDLIQKSAAVVGFNSTVVLEALAMRQALIVPRFAEAVDRYPDNVYFSEYDDVIHFAPSAEAMREMLDQAVAEPDAFRPKNDARLEEMLVRYFGATDGRTAERVRDHLRAAAGVKSAGQ